MYLFFQMAVPVGLENSKKVLIILDSIIGSYGVILNLEMEMVEKLLIQISTLELSSAPIGINTRSVPGPSTVKSSSF